MEDNNIQDELCFVNGKVIEITKKAIYIKVCFLNGRNEHTLRSLKWNSTDDALRYVEKVHHIRNTVIR
jgi:hypothetical protein